VTKTGTPLRVCVCGW